MTFEKWKNTLRVPEIYCAPATISTFLKHNGKSLLEPGREEKRK